MKSLKGNPYSTAILDSYRYTEKKLDLKNPGRAQKANDDLMGVHKEKEEISQIYFNSAIPKEKHTFNVNLPYLNERVPLVKDLK